MSDLQAFAAHARNMSTAKHKPDCWSGPMCVYASAQPRERCAWYCADGCTDKTKVSPDPNCPGCVSGNDRALWTRLADETDAYLARQPEPDLFGAEA